MDEKDKFDEFGNKVEYVSAEAKRLLEEQADAYRADYNEFQEDARKKFDRNQFERKAQTGGARIGKGARELLEFAGDTIGLFLLKNRGDRELAYKVIKGARKAGETAEGILGQVFTEGGKVVGQAAEQVDVDSLRDKAVELKDEMVRKVEDSDLLENVRVDELKNKVGDTLHKVTEKVKTVRADLTDEQESAEQKKEDLEAKIAAFEKLYEEESIERELHSNEGYKPEEAKVTREKY